MIVIVGFIVVLASVLGGFAMAGGHMHALVHPSELVTIGGAALGALIVMSPKKVLIDLVKGVLQTLKGAPFNKKAYVELFKVMYELMSEARRNGMLALESHLSNPHESNIFSKYPTVEKNHHTIKFICGTLTLLVDGAVAPDQIPKLINAELRTMEAEHHGPLTVLGKTADGLPGFGIVAAVMGIVITMGAIDGPVEEIGHKVGAALVGTFLGILLSYGFFAPLGVQMEFLGLAELAYYRTIGSMIEEMANSVPPKVIVEKARRGVPSDVRPSQEEMESILKEIG
ncbi:MAG: flagellar motor stator protein MotA [Planctomycetes bacterium]|nr:flagellar motor stator protein MotA [Planctomycetota bacterium]